MKLFISIVVLPSLLSAVFGFGSFFILLYFGINADDPCRMAISCVCFSLFGLVCGLFLSLCCVDTNQGVYK